MNLAIATHIKHKSINNNMDQKSQVVNPIQMVTLSDLRSSKCRIR